MDPKHDIRRQGDGLTPALGTPASASGGRRPARLTAGDYRLTVNPVDGTQVEPCPPGARPAHPARHTPEQTAARHLAAVPAPPPGPAAPPLPLLERDEVRERLVRLLAHGRSVRVTGPAGSGRTALLDAVAAECAELAPDGVIRLSGHQRTVTDLLHQLLGAVFDVPDLRPDRPQLLQLLQEVGAVVVLDDIGFGGAALDELLDATPECAFLIAAAPDVAAPSAEAHIEEIFLTGLSRRAGLQLLQDAVQRPLLEDERTWASDLWFACEGLPLRFVQAGGLLRQRDALRTAADAVEDETVEAGAGPEDDRPDMVEAPGDPVALPLPTLAESAAPAPLLAARASAAAREALRFAVALGGECPHHAHMPALAGDTHADTSVAELIGLGLLTPSGGHYHLADGVPEQLPEYASAPADGEPPLLLAAQHYAWWAGHTSVPAARVAGEADAVLAALSGLLAGASPAHASAAVLLARTAAPVFASALHWGAWERALRYGQEAARIAGEVAQEAYFHHELGILALCTGNLDRALAELEASVALRGAIGDRSGEITGRRALALVADRGGFELPVQPAAGDEVPPPDLDEDVTRDLHKVAPVLLDPGPPPAPRRPRRTILAAGAGAVLVAVFGTVVGLTALGSEDDDKPTDRVKVERSADDGEGSGLPADPSSPSTRSSSASASESASSLPVPVVPSTPGITRTPSTPATKSTPAGGSGGSHSGGSSTGGHSTGGSSSGPTTTTSPSDSGSPTESPDPTGGTTGATTTGAGGGAQ